MEVEVSAEAKDKRLNRLVAMTVVILSVFMGVSNIKDGNIVQAMAQAQANALDRWGEYQATRTKTHVAEAARTEIAVLERRASVAAGRRRPGEVRRRASPATDARRRSSPPRRAATARNMTRSTSTTTSSTRARRRSRPPSRWPRSPLLAESFWLLVGGWVFGAFGLFMGICGFAGWGFHPDLLSTLLG